MKKWSAVILVFLLVSPCFADMKLTGVKLSKATIFPYPAFYIWANDGADKVTQDETRMKNGTTVINDTWDGTTIHLTGAKNETVAFSIYIEAKTVSPNMNVSISNLDGTTPITTTRDTSSLFNFTGANIELFYIRYLQITGLSPLEYRGGAGSGSYDERHVPYKMRRPYHGSGVADTGTTWYSRPNHDKYYPDICVPLELVPTFTIIANQNQQIWCDIYIPKTTTAGTYTGTITVNQNGVAIKAIPISLVVKNFTLPDVPYAKTMVWYEEKNIWDRTLGNFYPNYPAESPTTQATMTEVWKNLHLVFHRHKLSLVDDGVSANQPTYTYPDSGTMAYQKWRKALDGSLFTSTYNYDGIGVNTTTGVISIGTYAAWRQTWGNLYDGSADEEAPIQTYLDQWYTFLSSYSGLTPIWYLLDEPNAANQAINELYAEYKQADSGNGKLIPSFVTSSVLTSYNTMPSTDIAVESSYGADSTTWQTTIAAWKALSKQVWIYNGSRPFDGTFVIEDEGIAPIVNGWIQYKHSIPVWFFWDADYWSHGTTYTDVFSDAATFSPSSSFNNSYGYANNSTGHGDGSLFYPGTEVRYTAQNYGIQGPISSIRMKLWRRGIQDCDYLNMAALIDKTTTDALVTTMIPKVNYEVGIDSTQKINDADFSASTHWTTSTGWTITGGKAVHNSNGTGTLSQTSANMVNAYMGYGTTLAYTISSLTAGTVTPSCGAWIGTTRSANGFYIEQFSGAGAGSSLVFTPSNTARFSLDDIYMVEDPTYVHSDISWSINPDDWENARVTLRNIIAP